MVRKGERTTGRTPRGSGRQRSGGAARQGAGGGDHPASSSGGRRDRKDAGGAPAAPPADARSGVDALFQLPLSEFTAARNALAARLKKGRRHEEAEAVKALPRPSLVAWAVNQLYWHHRDRFDRLLATGERFYDAQVAQLSGTPADLRGALAARREALSDLARLAADLLHAAGHAAAPDTMRRITTTLEALSSFGSAPQTPQAGRLTEDVLPPGFEALAPLVTRVGDEDSRGEGPTRVLPFRPAPAPAAGGAPPDAEALRTAARQAAADALREAEARLQLAKVAARHAEEALKRAAARAKETELEKTAAEERLAQLAAIAEEARAEARRVAVQAEEAAQALDEAERERDTAEVTLQQFEVSGT